MKNQYICQVDMLHPDLKSRPLGKFVPAEKIFHTSLEEPLELLGHILMGRTLLFATRKHSQS
jgi:hypothetical protein